MTLSSVQAAQERSEPRYDVETWTVENGLPQGTINGLLQTQDGALWIATNGGLLRFDGVEFRTFDFDTVRGLPSVRITGLEHDDAGGLWLLTQGGDVVQFRDGKVELVGEAHVPASPPQDLLAVTSTVGVQGGGLWFRGSGGSLWFSTRDILPGGVAKLVVASGCTDMCRDSSGRLMYANGTRLVRVSASGSEESALVAPGTITDLAAAGSDRLWVGLRDGLAIADGESIERVSLNPPLEARVSALVDDGESGAWVGTTAGLVHVVRATDGAGWARGSVPVGVLDGWEVRSLLLDRERNLWVGARGQGLARVTRKRVELHRPNRRAEGVAALAGDGAGGAWVSFANGGLSHASATKGVPDTLTWQIEPSPAAFALWHDASGSLWSALDRKASRRANGQVIEFSLPGRVGPIAETATGEVWISIAGGRRLARLSTTGEVLESLDVEGRVISLVGDPVEGLWAGEEGAVLRVRAGKVERFGPDHGIPEGDVRSILPEPDGSAWIASYGGGLALLENGRAARISRAQGLPNMSLSCIQDDGLQRLWLLSNQGLIVAERADLQAIVEGRAARFDPVVLGSAAGVPEGNFGSPAGFKDERGRLWFGTIEGPVRVDPRAFPFNQTALEVKIESLWADDELLALGSTVEVPAATRRLVVRFTTFSLTAPNRVHFRYRLDGLDDHWNDAGTARSVSYTILRPGEYQFQVEARNEDGVWSETPAKIKVRVAPSWWQTIPFMLAMGLLGIACVYLFDRVRVGIVSRRARVLLDATEGKARAEERESRLREELAHIGRVMTAGELATSLAHEVNQPLAAIVTNAQAGRRYLANPSLDKRNLDEILRDIAQQGQRASEIIQRLREFLRKHDSERKTIDLNAVVRDTLPLVRRELQDHRVELVLNLDPSLKTVDADPIQIQQVVVNLVNNACDAMSQSGASRRLELRTTTDGDRTMLEVLDNGPGIAPEVLDRLFQPYVTTKPSGMGLGLAICRSIVEAHGGRISAEPGRGTGALMRVQFPTRTEETLNS